MKEITFMLNTKEELERLESKFDADSTMHQLEKLGFKDGMQFLDVGSAGGALTRFVANLAPNSKILGIDKNEDYIVYAEQLSQKKGITNVSYKQGNVYNLPFEENSFDFVWCRFLLEYLKDPILAIKEMRRVARTNGIVCCGDLDGNCLFHYPIEKTLENKLNRIMNLLASFGFDPFVGRKLYCYFKQVGFKKMQVELFPHHNIFGQPDEKTSQNWKNKVNSTIEFLRGKVAVDLKFLDLVREEFLDYIHDESTFTYSTLIFAKGIK